MYTSHISETCHMLQKRKVHTASKGFSLIETLVILAVLGILAGLSGTALYKWQPQANLKRAARTIVSMCQSARMEAIKRNQSVSLNCTGTTCVVRLADNTQLRRFDLSTLQSGVQLTNAFDTNFTSRGRATKAGPISIKNNAENTLTVTVRPSGSIVTN